MEDDVRDVQTDAAGAGIAELLKDLEAREREPVMAAVGSDDDAAGPHGPGAIAAVGGQALGVEVELEPGFGEVAGFRDAARGPLQQALDEQGAEPVGIEGGGILFQGAGQDSGHARGVRAGMDQTPQQ